jgi:hypothetical protein
MVHLSNINEEIKMAQPAWLKKYLTMKPEVVKIFDDLETWHDHCRMEMIDFKPEDLYKSNEYKEWSRKKHFKNKPFRSFKNNKFSNKE